MLTGNCMMADCASVVPEWCRSCLARLATMMFDVLCCAVQHANYEALDEMCACAYYVDHAIEEVSLMLQL